MASTERAVRRPAGASAARVAVLHFSVSYWTKWGQAMVVLGSWDEASKRGHRLVCRHAEEGVLVWEARISVPLSAPHVSYRYAVVNDASDIEVEEGGARVLALPADLHDSAVIELQDAWQVSGFRHLDVRASRRSWEWRLACLGVAPNSTTVHCNLAGYPAFSAQSMANLQL